MLRVTQALGLKQSQPPRFLDVDLENDTPYFIDPLKLSKSANLNGRQALTRLRTFFSTVLSAVVSKEPFIAEDMIAGLQERPETRLGLCKSGFRGRGAGQSVGKQFVRALQNSVAVQSGLVADIMDVAVFINGVGPDIVSDIVTNLIIPELCQFTDMILKESTVPRKPIKYPSWNPKLLEWTSIEISLARVHRSPVILVPFDIVSSSFAYGPASFETYAIRTAIGDGTDAVSRLFTAIGLDGTVASSWWTEARLSKRLAEQRQASNAKHKAQVASIAQAMPEYYSRWKKSLGAQPLSPTAQELEAIQERVRHRLKKHNYLHGVTRPATLAAIRRLKAPEALALPSSNWVLCPACHFPTRRNGTDGHQKTCSGVIKAGNQQWVECAGCSNIVNSKKFESHQAKCRVAHTNVKK